MSYPKREINRLKSAQLALQEVYKRGYECATLARIIDQQIWELLARIEKQDLENKQEINPIHKAFWGF